MDSELEQYVDKLVNDENPKEVISFAELEQERSRLVKLIEDHNADMASLRDNDDLQDFIVPDDWMIEI